MGYGSDGDDQRAVTAGEAMRQILENAGASAVLIQHAEDLIRAGCPLAEPSWIDGEALGWGAAGHSVRINTHLPMLDVLAEGTASGGDDARAEAVVLVAPGHRAIAIEIWGPDRDVAAALIDRSEAGPWMIERQQNWDELDLAIRVSTRARRIDGDRRDPAAEPAGHFGLDGFEGDEARDLDDAA